MDRKPLGLRLPWIDFHRGGEGPAHFWVLCAEPALAPTTTLGTLPSRHPAQTASWAPSHAAPGKSSLISSEYYVISFYIRCLLSLEPALWECSFQGRQWGAQDRPGEVTPPGASGLPALHNEKTNPQQQFKPCLYTLWLLNYLFLKKLYYRSLIHLPQCRL